MVVRGHNPAASGVDAGFRLPVFQVGLLQRIDDDVSIGVGVLIAPPQHRGMVFLETGRL